MCNYMSHNCQYVQLLSALPRLPAPGVIKYLPISQILLDRRLQMLTEGHLQILEELVALMQWQGRRISMDIKGFSQRLHSVRALNQKFHDLIGYFFQLHLVVRCLSLKFNQQNEAKGTRLPELYDIDFNGENLARTILANWSKDYFGVQYRFPWIKEVDNLLQQGDVFAVERLLINDWWRCLELQLASEFYSFKAVVIYVLKWHLVNHWLSYSQAEAGKRFNEEVTQTMKRWEGQAAPFL